MGSFLIDSPHGFSFYTMSNHTHSAEVRNKISEAHIRYNQTEAGLAKRKMLSELRTGSKASDETRAKMRLAQGGRANSNWTPFELVVVPPDEEPVIHLFDGDTPYLDCTKMFGLHNLLKLLKQGEIITITRRNTRTVHPWVRGTQLYINKL